MYILTDDFMGVTGNETPFEKLATNPVDPFSDSWTLEHTAAVFGNFTSNDHLPSANCKSFLDEKSTLRRNTSRSTIQTILKGLFEMQAGMSGSLAEGRANDNAGPLLISKSWCLQFQICLYSLCGRVECQGLNKCK